MALPARGRVHMTGPWAFLQHVVVVRLVITKTLYNGMYAKSEQIFAVRHPGDERARQ